MKTIPFRAYTPGTQPPYDAPAYGSTHKRHPREALVPVPHTTTEISGPRFTAAQSPPLPDLSVVDGKSALGGRIIVHGRITDEDGRPIPHTPPPLMTTTPWERAVPMAELGGAPAQVQELLAEMVALSELVDVTEETTDLQEAYLDAGIVTPRSAFTDDREIRVQGQFQSMVSI